jgi:hypothetical protein
MKTLNGNSLDRSWALFFARLVLGLIFFMAGVWKVFELGPLEHARKFFLPYTDTFLPVWSLWTVGVIVPFVELIAGALVILGLRTRVALVSLSWPRFSYCDLWTSVNGAALRVPYARHSTSCPAVVHPSDATRR